MLILFSCKIYMYVVNELQLFIYDIVLFITPTVSNEIRAGAESKVKLNIKE